MRTYATYGLTVILLAVSLPVLYAQEGVLKVHPASAQGKLLTMEQVTVGRSVYPVNNYARWTSDTTYAVLEGSNWENRSIRSGSATAQPPQLPAMKMLPEGAANRTVCGENIAFTRDGSLFLATPEGVRTIASSPGDGIVFGTSVSRNEFGIEGGIFPSPDGGQIAFYRKDETAVTKFPLLDITTRTGTLREIRYPMNGMASEHITLGVYDIARARTVWITPDDFDDERYLTNISWAPDGRYLYIQVLSRSQHEMHLNMYRAADGKLVRTLLTERNDAWVEPQDPVHFVRGREDVFLYRTDNRDGWENLYLADTLGNIRRLTQVDADVEYLGNDGQTVWYSSSEVSPAERHLFALGMGSTLRALEADKAARSGKRPKPYRAKPKDFPRALTTASGWHEISLSDDCKYFIDNFSAFNTPREVSLCRASDGSKVRHLLTAPDPLSGYKTGEVILGTVKSADGKYDNHYRLLKPADFDPSRKYPVILYVYGGPHSQMVRDSWLGQIRMWEMLMAQKGYVVYVQDNRGTQHHGAAYEKAINRRCGQAEMADQMEGIRMLQSLPWVDGSRIGVHGWSYGGFMTISLMTTWPDVFKAGVAGGPVIDWKWYEVMYGERYMDTAETNPEGFAETSLLSKAPDLKGRLLICQGAVDNTVVWEHSLSFIQECIRHQVRVDYFLYPVAEHNVFGRDRIHLMDKVTDWFDQYL